MEQVAVVGRALGSAGHNNKHCSRWGTRHYRITDWFNDVNNFMDLGKLGGASKKPKIFDPQFRKL